MGACFNDMTLGDELDKQAVKEQFQQAQDDDCYENGHSYGGGFGMARGLKFDPEPTFASEELALNYLQDKCIKWEEARAVRFKQADGKEAWLIGAWCSS
jgi:hypothetical protein